MLFTPDTVQSLRSAVALANSAEPPDTLTGTAALGEFFTRDGYTGLHRGTLAELNEVRASRRLLRLLLTSRGESGVDLINGILRDARAVPQLVRHGSYDWHVHAAAPNAPLAVRILVETAMAMIEVRRAGGLDRLAVCQAAGCSRLLLDLSKSGSRRYCSSACGNRMAVAAYRERKRRAG